MSEADLDQKINTLETGNAALREEIMGYNDEINEQEEDFKEVQLMCDELVLDFKGAMFQTSVATPMDYDQHTQFTETNITQYLAELEEYIANLIQHQAHKRGDPNASTSSVPFTSLNCKDWLSRDMNIDPAFDVVAHTADQDEEEEATPSTQVLY